MPGHVLGLDHDRQGLLNFPSDFRGLGVVYKSTPAARNVRDSSASVHLADS